MDDLKTFQSKPVLTGPHHYRGCVLQRSIVNNWYVRSSDPQLKVPRGLTSHSLERLRELIDKALDKAKETV